MPLLSPHFVLRPGNGIGRCSPHTQIGTVSTRGAYHGRRLGEDSGFLFERTSSFLTFSPDVRRPVSVPPIDIRFPPLRPSVHVPRCPGRRNPQIGPAKHRLRAARHFPRPLLSASLSLPPPIRDSDNTPQPHHGDFTPSRPHLRPLPPRPGNLLEPPCIPTPLAHTALPSTTAHTQTITQRRHARPLVLVPRRRDLNDIQLRRQTCAQWQWGECRNHLGVACHRGQGEDYISTAVGGGRGAGGRFEGGGCEKGGYGVVVQYVVVIKAVFCEMG